MPIFKFLLKLVFEKYSIVRSKKGKIEFVKIRENVHC